MLYEVITEREVARLDVGQDAFEPGDDGAGFLLGDDPLLGQHPGVGDGALDIVAIHALVEIDGGGELFHKLVGGLGEAAGPGFFTHDVV